MGMMLNTKSVIKMGKSNYYYSVCERERIWEVNIVNNSLMFSRGY